MVKTPRTRHSHTEKKPVTIDLAPDEVSRVVADDKPSAKQEAEPKMAESTPVEPKIADAKVTEPKADKAETAEPKTVGPKTAEPKTAESKTAGPRPTGPTPTGRQEQAAPPARRGGGGLVAGLVGGVAALALAAGLQFAGVLPQPQATGPVVADNGPAIAALEGELGKLRQEIAALNGAANDDSAFAARLSDAETQMAAFASGLESLRGEVATLEPGTPGEAASVDLGPIEEKIAALEAALSQLPDTSAIQTTLAGLQNEITTMRDGQTQAASGLENLQTTVKTLTGRVDEQEQAPATAIIIAASSLKAAIDRGAPFAAELDTYAALVPDAPQLDELRSLAAAGVPTRAQRSASSDAAANAMIAASRPVDPQASVTDRLWSSMMGLVQVRPIGMVEGDGVPEIVARLDAAVQAGDYQRALGEYDALPPEAKAAGQAFSAQLRARHSADQLVDEALAAALKA